MSKKKKEKSGNRLTDHHIHPRCRGGGEKKSKIIKLPRKIHEAWHMLFGHCLPEEAIEFIQVVFFGKGLKRDKMRWTTEELFELRLDIQKETFNRKRKRPKKKKALVLSLFSSRS